MGTKDARAITIVSLGSLVFLGALFLRHPDELGNSLVLVGGMTALICGFLLATGGGALTAIPAWPRQLVASAIPAVFLTLCLLLLLESVAELVRLHEDVLDGKYADPILIAVWAISGFGFYRWVRLDVGSQVRRKAILFVGGVGAAVALICGLISTITTRRTDFLAGIAAQLGMGAGVGGVYWAAAVLVASRLSGSQGEQSTRI